MKLALSLIRRDGGTQPREALHQPAIDDYAEGFREGAAFPAVVVFFDGTTYWLADGFHRCAGAELAELEEIEADVRQGTRREAVLFSVGANVSHGLQRTTADKERAVRVLLEDEEWSRWSDRKIAAACKVTHPFVAKLRRGATRAAKGPDSEPPPESKTAGEVATTVAGRVSKVEKRVNALRDELRTLCSDKRARVLLEDTLLGLARDVYAIADGSAFGAEEHA